jgi:hypothetical protein
MGEPTTEQWQEIQAHLFAGRKIQAIKVYREAAGVGLKEAKDAMEAYAAKLYEQSPQSFAKDPTAKSGCLGVFLLILLGAIAVLFVCVANLAVS